MYLGLPVKFENLLFIKKFKLKVFHFHFILSERCLNQLSKILFVVSLV